MAKAAPALIFVATLALGGCTRVDDPTNIPRLGHWQSTWRLVGFNIDGRSIDRETAPFPLPPDKTEDKGCVEPTLRDRREISAALSGLGKSSCSLASFDRDGASITGQGRCTFPSRAGVSVGGTFSIALDEAPEHAGGLQQIEVYAHLPDGQTSRSTPPTSSNGPDWATAGPEDSPERSDFAMRGPAAGKGTNRRPGLRRGDDQIALPAP